MPAELLANDTPPLNVFIPPPILGMPGPVELAIRKSALQCHQLPSNHTLCLLPRVCRIQIGIRHRPTGCKTSKSEAAGRYDDAKRQEAESATIEAITGVVILRVGHPNPRGNSNLLQTVHFA